MTHWNVQHLSDVLASFGWMEKIGGAMLVIVQTVIPVIPFVIVAGANVLLFGFWGGFLINYVFACVGAVLTFMVARHSGQAWVERKLAKYAYVSKFNDKLEKQGMWYILISRIVPVLPSTGINLAAAVMKVRLRDFVIGTMIGKVPMILLESVIGYDLIHFQKYKGRLFLLLVVLAAMMVIGNYYKNKWIRSGSKS